MEIAMSDSPSTSKRQADEMTNDTLRGRAGDHRIGFFCECARERR
jgi:hypothetical protein